MGLFLILLIIVLGVSIYINVNLYNKVQRYEDEFEDAEKYVDELSSYVYSMQENAANALRRMKEVDRKGAFESDDEVGYIFTEIKKIVTELNNKTEINE